MKKKMVKRLMIITVYRKDTLDTAQFLIFSAT
jgi:hypothetical protein